MYLSNTGFIYMYCNTINCNSYIYNFCSFFLSLKKVCLWQYSRQSQLHWWLRIQWGDPWSLQLLTGCQQIWLCCQLWFCQMLEHWSRSSQISTLAHAVILSKECNRLYYGFNTCKYYPLSFASQYCSFFGKMYNLCIHSWVSEAVLPV